MMGWKANNGVNESDVQPINAFCLLMPNDDMLELDGILSRFIETFSVLPLANCKILSPKLL